jgi:ATP-binding cassette subfamily F protein 3
MAGDFLFWDTDLMKSIDVLSGGEKARLSLASLLLKKHEILLLDEPTNHLDFETVEALANGLAQARNTTILFVSHNRRFIHTVAEEIIEVGDGTAKKFMHDYDNYLYHLKSRLAIKSDKPDEHDHVPTEDNTAKERRSELYSLIKTKQAAITRLEGIIEKQATKKQRLMDWFAKHPTEFNQNKIDALTAINTEIEITESEWEKESDELTAMMNELDTLR